MDHKKKEIIDELEQMAPFLSKMKAEKEGFEVPPQYFRQLKADLLLQNAPKAKNAPYRWSIFKDGIFGVATYRVVLSLASLAILIGVGLYWINQKDGLSSPMAALDSLSIAEIVQYVDANLDDFDFEMLVNTIDGPIDIDVIPTEQLEEELIDELYESLIDDIDLHEMEDLF